MPAGPAVAAALPQSGFSVTRWLRSWTPDGGRKSSTTTALAGAGSASERGVLVLVPLSVELVENGAEVLRVGEESDDVEVVCTHE